MSTLTWLDFSDAERKRALQVVELLGQPETRDEQAGCYVVPVTRRLGCVVGISHDPNLSIVFHRFHLSHALCACQPLEYFPSARQRSYTAPVLLDARQHLKSLQGQTIYTLAQRRANRIVHVEGDSVIVATDKSPHGEPVPIQRVQDALDELFREGEIVVTVESVGYRSAFIGAVLGTLPDVEVLTRPRRVRLTRGGGKGP